MSGLLTTASTLMCPHGGTVTIISSNTQITAAGSPIVVAGDTFTVAGCPFPLPGPPHPCVSVKWVSPATGSKVSGGATLTEASVGLCVAADQAPQGTVLIVATQASVSGR
jgi:hypothetical protein